jgi:phage tail sheath protein FI
MKALEDASTTGMTAAKETMMADLQRDFGAQTDAKITQSKQGLAYIAEQAGISEEAIKAALQSLTDKTGDAMVIRIFAKVGELIGEDAIAGGKGGGFSTTPAEARAEIAKLRGPDGDYSKAVAANDRPRLAELGKRMETLTKIAAQVSSS